MTLYSLGGIFSVLGGMPANFLEFTGIPGRRRGDLNPIAGKGLTLANKGK